MANFPLDLVNALRDSKKALYVSRDDMLHLLGTRSKRKLESCLSVLVNSGIIIKGKAIPHRRCCSYELTEDARALLEAYECRRQPKSA
jgi:hypothetical protein